MRHRVRRLVALIGIIALLVTASVANAAEIAWRSFTFEGIDRIYGVYAPVDPTDPAPLVVLLHGGGGRAVKTWTQEHGRSWRALADEHGFVLLLPEGLDDPGDEDSHHWNDCRIGLDESVIATNALDVGFVVGLIEHVSGFLPIAPTRVYATGASNGGMMTYRLAIEAPAVFAAAAAVIANLPEPSECERATVPVPMLIMNGTEDPLMPFDGGCVAGDRCRRGRVMSTADTVAFWVETNGASRDPSVTQLPQRSWLDASSVIVYRFEGGQDGADVVYYHVKGGGHTVPGFESHPVARRLIAGPKNRDIDAASEIWAFFQQHRSDNPAVNR